MKKIISAFLITLLLSGCSFLQVKKHDPGLASGYVHLKVFLNDADCELIDTLEDSYYAAVWVQEYARFTTDPLVKNTDNIVKYLKSALDASYDERLTACKRWLNLVNINMKILKTDWGTR